MAQSAVASLLHSTHTPADAKPAGQSPRIVYLTAGAATRYCGSCLHDNGLARALSAAGEDILLVPTYTPLRTDEENVSLNRVFFGGVNVYLAAAVGPVSPHAVVFRSPARFATIAELAFQPQRRHGSGQTRSAHRFHASRAKRASSGKKSKKLVQLAQAGSPAGGHSSFQRIALGHGAGNCASELRVPIVCGLGRRRFVSGATEEPHYSQVRELLRQQANEVDAFVAYNHYFADFMAEYLSVDRSRIEVIRHGLRFDGHGARQHVRRTSRSRSVIFGRIAPEKGLHLLVEAFALLCRRSIAAAAAIESRRLQIVRRRTVFRNR